MCQRSNSLYTRIKQRWMEFWGLVFFLGVLINFSEIICRTVFHFSIDLMYDLPVWLTIWAVMMLAGPILLENEHVSVDMIRDNIHGYPRKLLEIINCLATISFGFIVTWSGCIFISQCYRFNMKIIRCISIPRCIVEACIPLGMAVFTIYAFIQLWNVFRKDYSKKS